MKDFPPQNTENGDRHAECGYVPTSPKKKLEASVADMFKKFPPKPRD